MIDEKKIILEMGVFERELKQFENDRLNREMELKNPGDLGYYFRILDSIDNCHRKYAYALEFNKKLKIRKDKLNKIITSNL